LRAQHRNSEKRRVKAKSTAITSGSQSISAGLSQFAVHPRAKNKKLHFSGAKLWFMGAIAGFLTWAGC
jgi:hypothetical protein